MENMLYYKKSAKYFEEALPLGNGRMGAMVFGGTKTERIALNEDSLGRVIRRTIIINPPTNILKR